MNYSLPKLPYEYGELEPYIDTLTMEIHHARHHQAYVDNLNKALAQVPEFHANSLEDLLKSINTVPESARTAIKNHGGGHYNHSMFWKVMSKAGGGQPQGPVGDAIKKCFGTFDAFQDTFNITAKKVFGSGWAWLCVDDDGRLVIKGSLNQDSPLSDGLHPILCLDVWEHAYYLKYQNKRPDYIQAWWHVVNWEQVEENYDVLIG